MESVSWGKKRLERGAAATALLLGLLVSPISAAANTVQPVQILPPGSGKTCAPVTLSDIQAHIYNGYLDSFDVTISDPSYIAISTSVNNSVVGLNYVTRWAHADGSIKMHVDLQSIRMNKDVPIAITFMATRADASGNSITCLFNVPASIGAVQIQSVGGTAGQVSTGSGQGTGQGQVRPIQVPPTTPPTARPVSTTDTPTPIGTGSGTASATGTNNPGVVAAMSSLGNLCTDGGSARLWIVLLVLFALFTFTLSVRRLEATTNVRDWNIGLILAVFVGLLIFWYTSAVCRAGPWAPALATLITIVGLLYSMLKSDDTQEILLLKDGKK